MVGMIDVVVGAVDVAEWVSVYAAECLGEQTFVVDLVAFDSD